ncbi:hypothetical protein MJT46_000066 [Ovis ammon polii x Ovis aries]|uniref:Uncharacterized protein n=1 Tax=Ovis aries TaxID=9940 RepID=A0A836ANN6_SHEEP|nr:hypothetical protein JEQ12_001935 [Ovis aries]KAI4578698.1 hypothetical protein MJT46_000066 [Ovis ammon polii x Ovis aries]
MSSNTHMTLVTGAHKGIAFKGRVVNVSSSVSVSSLKKCSPELQQKFQSETITEEELVGLMNKFVEDTKNGVHRKEGAPDNINGVRKIGVTVLSGIQARKLSGWTERKRENPPECLLPRVGEN